MYVIMAMAVCRHSVGKSLDFSGFAMKQETVDNNVQFFKPGNVTL